MQPAGKKTETRGKMKAVHGKNEKVIRDQRDKRAEEEFLLSIFTVTQALGWSKSQIGALADSTDGVFGQHPRAPLLSIR